MNARSFGVIIALSALIVVLATAVPAGAGVTRRAVPNALVVNVDSYRYLQGEVPPQRFEAVEGFARQLQADGYQLSWLSGDHADRATTIQEVARLRDRGAPGDAMVVLLAGTLARNSQNRRVYWLPFDSRLDLLDSSSIRLAHLIELLAEIPASRKLVLIDATFGGDIEGRLAFPGRSDNQGVVVAADPRGFSSEVPISSAELGEELRLSGDDIDVLVSLSATVSGTSRPTLSSLAVRALTEPHADIDGDGSLSVSELVDFVRKSAPDLHRLFFQTSFGPSWMIASVREDLEKDRAAEYEEILESWRLTGWISTRTYILARNALDDWRESRESGIEIGPSAQKTLDELRNILDSRGTVSDEDLAFEFQLVVQGVR